MVRGLPALLLRVSPALAMRPVGSRLYTPLSAHLLRSSFAPPAGAALLSRAGAVRMMVADRTVVGTCKAKIAAALDPKELDVQGAFDDPNGSHITIYCVAEAFEGKRSLARQQLVYKAIWEEMKGTAAPVHAVDSMVLKAPSEV